jgi:hypothetical protein
LGFRALNNSIRVLTGKDKVTQTTIHKPFFTATMTSRGPIRDLEIGETFSQEEVEAIFDTNFGY